MPKSDNASQPPTILSDIMTFQPPLRDIRFCLDHVIDHDSLRGFEDYDLDLRDAVLDAAAQLSSEILAPLNWVGDQNPARLDGDKVIVSPGFLEAIKAFAEGGWYGLTAPTAYGGQGLPKLLEQACYDQFHAANMAFTLLPTLSQGAIEALIHHGTEAQKARYLPSLIEGKWSGTMNLTEPHAGSDLSVLTSKAEPLGDGLYAITGQKIYITWGEHEGCENIMHLVLARLPEAPAGTKGISLFLCPKYLMDDQSNPTQRNNVRCVGLEHKLGIHASPTCVMSYEGAIGELVGEAHGGLKAMFTMMNAARLAVGMQGVGIAEIAFQKALAYARDRKQGISAITQKPSSPLIDHPDIRLKLGLMKARIEAARAICYLTALSIDQAHQATDVGEKALAQGRADLLVPIAKSWSTDRGLEIASLGLQIHGGMGFIEETGAAQHLRDARIAPIYEGTNAIQALDLVGRKLHKDGATAFELIKWMADFKAPPSLTTEGETLMVGLDALEQATEWLLKAKVSQPLDVAAAASPYLELFGVIVGGYLLIKGAAKAEALSGDNQQDPTYLSHRIDLARLYCAHDLSHAKAFLEQIQCGMKPLEAMVFDHY